MIFFRPSLFALLAGLLALVSTQLPARADEPIHPAPPVDMDHLPWIDGEKLTYLVSWTGFDAAEGTFTARKKSDRWEFRLDLASRGLVDDMYPFTCSFWSILSPSVWRSAEYGSYRFEPKRTVKYRTRIDYAAHHGTWENWMDGKTKTFPVDREALDDIGSMLYHTRTGPWNPGDKRTLFLYESDKEKQAEAECKSRETAAIGTWPKQPVIHILMLPTKGTRRRGSLDIWMTDDARRLPIRAVLHFIYGSFSIDLVKAEKTNGK